MCDLDDLKKNKEGARDAIKWLESEFKKGNRFMRTQRELESLALPLLKIPSKLGKQLGKCFNWTNTLMFIVSLTDNDSAVFMKIAQFANFIVTSNSQFDEESDFPVLTLLTGDNWDDRKKQQPQLSSPLNFLGILQSIPVHYEQIFRFYSKSKKK